MKSKHTKGEIRFIHNSFDCISEFYESMDGESIFTIRHNEATLFSSTKDNAQLIADAFNVTNETGLTPKELQKSHAELLRGLKIAIKVSRWTDYSKGSEYDIAKTILEKATK